MKLKITLALILYILGAVYLTAPSPPYPDLDGGARSDEPGDTWQHPDQKAFFTNRTRGEVIPEMQRKFTLKIFGVAVPSFRLNYRPEESFELIRDQVPSYYLEEIIYPFRESLFVNGWEPTNTPGYKNAIPGKIPLATFKGDTYLGKITLRPVNSYVWARLFVWALIFPSVYLVYLSLKRSLRA